MTDVMAMLKELEKNYQTMQTTEKRRICQGWSCPDGTFAAYTLEGLIGLDLIDHENPEAERLYAQLIADYDDIRKYIKGLEDIEIDENTFNRGMHRTDG